MYPTEQKQKKVKIFLTIKRKVFFQVKILNINIFSPNIDRTHNSLRDGKFK